MKLSCSKIVLAGLFLSSAHGQDCETKLIAFGDSLTDNGNLYGITGGALPPALGYAEGRFTNGFVWVEFLADALGLARPAPRYPAASGTNYAVAGASTGDGETSTWTPMLTGASTTLPALGVRRQVDDFVADMAAGAHPHLCVDSPVVLWGGPAEMVVLGGAPAYEDMLEDLAGSVAALIDGAGLTNIIVLNVPPLFAAPAANGVPSLFVPATLPGEDLAGNIPAYNAGLLPLLEEMRGEHACVEITHVDAFSIIGGIAGDPAGYGIEGDFMTPVINETALFTMNELEYTNVANAFWFDGVHPTETVHEIVAGEFYKVLTQETEQKVSKGCKTGKGTKAPKKGKKEGKTSKGGKTKKNKTGKKTAAPE
eukprot:CAMPEP_0194300032 /NCGR_PEP_ID=MMETSP0169-20130528/61035_1 /TAXON_ID=218684 /ORGANISM="Corethron pennatum, Strain L29A3" /LENGTH=367 /DNA_ID=CAMNT_0039050167 /DNA_START=90 /DNA_END=1193 /DNA_ORIENTATION=-